MSRKGTRQGHRTTRGEPCQCESGCFELGVMLPTKAWPQSWMGFMRLAHIRLSSGLLSLLMAGLLLGCQSTPPVTEGYPHQLALRGKTRDQVLACAGTPLQEREDAAVLTLRYYKEAPLLEESMVGSKGSRPTVHHGCWATVILQDHRVDHVRYRFVPGSVDASNDCEEIFANCPE